ncbi:hypothetical protein G4B88_021833 [Cannabis sativa]|uniref:DUF4283 domain-containing protein n=2 Tax=Cannabis sativa TaxID=3483 RepID=A0A7J6EIA6_CANSA|nr:hypothetical protein G4B88_021833 [Cannabis sativa]
MLLCIMEKVPTNVSVKTVDENMNNTLVRDSALELEMLELFEDITLEDVVANKACVGKVIGCKDMSTSVVKKILTGVWRRLGPWRMKKCEEGVLGFFFEHEEDCSFVLLKRPWLVNGVLLNIKPWPVEGEVRAGEFAVARFWVQIHGLPTRCLTNDNAPIVAKKIGELVETDGKSKSKLGKGVLKMTFDSGDIPEWELNARSRRGFWKPVESRRLSKKSGSTEKGVTGDAMASKYQIQEKGGGEKDKQSYEADTSSGNVGIERVRMVMAYPPTWKLRGTTEKRKAHTWYQPFPPVSNFSSPSSPANFVNASDKDEASKDTFYIGVGDEGSCSQPRIRGRKTRGKSKRGGYGSLDFQFLGKLKGVKYDLKKWNQEVFGFSDRRLVALRRQLAEIQKDSISHASVQRESEVQLEIIEMEERMDRIWRQKSRENWIRFGDANSKFFHTSTIIRRRRNFIGYVEDSHGVWLSDREEIGNYFNHHFRDIFELTGSTIDNEFSIESINRKVVWSSRLIRPEDAVMISRKVWVLVV